MGRYVLAIAFLTATLTPVIAWAGPRGSGAEELSAPDNKKGAGAINWSINISAQLPGSGGTSGACTGGMGLADYCPIGPCTCYTSTGTASGSVGHGSATVYETVDYGQEFGVNDDCATAYFDIEITGAGKDDESIAGTGGDCYNGSVTSTEYVSGGCEIGAASTLFSIAEGQCSGSYAALKSGSYPLKISIKGKAIK